jgi:hypothetical protein
MTYLVICVMEKLGLAWNIMRRCQASETPS